MNESIQFEVLYYKTYVYFGAQLLPMPMPAY